MTEQRIETEPTEFGRAVIDLTLERGLWAPEDLNLSADYAELLSHHLAGTTDGREDPIEFVQAVAHGIGLDPWDSADYEPCMELAYTHLYCKPYPRDRG